LIAILGSGFGLYGYLPAFAEARDEEIILPERYRPRLAARAELAGVAGRVHWSVDEAHALHRASTIAIAKRPSDQVALVAQCLARENVERLLLEKPLAPTPEAAGALLDRVASSGRVLRIGYTFRRTAWAASLARLLTTPSAGTLAIHWRFTAHHYAHDLHTWKRRHDQGGGALRFYGIQLIALLAEFGYRDPVASQCAGVGMGEVDRWTATFAAGGLPDCTIVVDSRSDVTEFRVEQRVGDAAPHVLVAQRDPFSTAATAGGLDPRVGLLQELCASLWSGDTCYAWYSAANALWRDVEAQTTFAAT
jgi:predicted dehydrogenase